jgi:hypothetical protein
MDASGSFRHVGSAGRGWRTDGDGSRSSASVRSPLLRVVGKLEVITMVSALRLPFFQDSGGSPRIFLPIRASI